MGATANPWRPEPVVEPYHLKYGNLPGFKAAHWNDRLKMVIGWLKEPWFMWEEPGIYTPQRFAQWGRLEDAVRLQSGGFGQNTGLQLILREEPVEDFKERLHRFYEKYPELHNDEYRYAPYKGQLLEALSDEVDRVEEHREWKGSAPNHQNLPPQDRMRSTTQESKRYSPITGRTLEGPTIVHLTPKVDISKIGLKVDLSVGEALEELKAGKVVKVPYLKLEDAMVQDAMRQKVEEVLKAVGAQHLIHDEYICTPDASGSLSPEELKEAMQASQDLQGHVLLALDHADLEARTLVVLKEKADPKPLMKLASETRTAREVFGDLFKK
jgi:hypothetical protein